MTPEEEKEIIRVCGKNYSWWDIPTYIRNRDAENEANYLSQIEEEGIQEKREREEREKIENYDLTELL